VSAASWRPPWSPLQRYCRSSSLRKEVRVDPLTRLVAALVASAAGTLQATVKQASKTATPP
jgi:hypothetical protein